METTHAATAPTRRVGERRELNFRPARLNELGRLKEIYNASWCKSDLLRSFGFSEGKIEPAMAGLMVSESQLAEQVTKFPEGQIVACFEGSDIPIAMITILVRVFKGVTHIPGGYNSFTGDRTWNTHVPIEEALRSASEIGGIPIAFCMSIVVDPSVQSGGIALQLLNHAIEFGESAGLVVVPYSAPRGLAEFISKHPGIIFDDLATYLHLTKPPTVDYGGYLARLNRFNTGKGSRFYRIPLTALREDEFSRFNSEETYTVSNGTNSTSTVTIPTTGFGKSYRVLNEGFRAVHGRPLTVEDFVVLTGRSLIDPVMDMHVRNGARFLRLENGRIYAFQESRLEDLQSGGWNVPLTYTPRVELLGPDFNWLRTP